MFISDMVEYEIFQIKDIKKVNYAFGDFSKEFNFNDYKSVYKDEIKNANNKEIILEKLYEIFNINHPKDFRGHSLSTSDIVRLNCRYFYCNSFGWEELNKEE